MILFLFLPLELLLGPDHDLKSYSAILLFQTTKSHSFSFIRNLYHFFFLYSSVQGSTTQVGPIGLWHFEFKLHLPYLGVTTKSRTSFLFREGPILRAPASMQAFQRPPRPSWQHQHLLIINGGKWLPRTRKHDSHWSWHCSIIRSTSNFLAHPRWRRAGSKPSLVVVFGHISCSMVASLC